MKKKKFAKLREWNRRRNYFMKALRMHIARIRYDEKKPKNFDLSSIKRVLFLRDDDKIGDMVVSTSLFREFFRAGYVVDVLAGKNNINVIENNPYIRKTIISPATLEEKLALAKKLATEAYDLIVDMGDTMSPSHLRFIKAINANNVIGFNKSQYNLYNKSLDYLGFDRHITARYALLMESLEFKNFTTDYDLHCSDEVKSLVGDFIVSLSGTLKIVINPFSATSKRDLSIEQIRELVARTKAKWPHCDIILIGIKKRISELNIPETCINPFNTLSSAIEIVRLADLVISPDTSIVHIATAWKKPLVCLYGNDIHGHFINSAVWGPGNTQSVQLFTKDKYHPVSTIAVDDIVSAMERLLD